MENAGRLSVMLDCSRNAIMHLPALKRFISNIKKMGYDRLLLYMEDVYELDGEPLFGYMRGRYSKAELKEIDAYGVSVGVEIVPCIQTLAHLHQMFQWRKYHEIRDMNDVLLIGEEKTYELIGKMFQTCAECFSTKTIHIGMDEAFMMGLGKYREKHGFVDRNELFLGHLDRVCGQVKEYGFERIIIWSDMFFNLAFGQYSADGELAPEVLEKVPEGLELVFYDYSSDTYEAYEKMIKAHLAFGNPVSFGAGAWKWAVLTPINQYSIPRNEVALRACRDYGVKDTMLTLWGDDGWECSAYAVLPTLMHFAECAKGNYDMQSIKQKFLEIFGVPFDDFTLLDLRFPDTFKKKTPESNGAKAMFYSDPFIGKYDSTVCGTGEERRQYEVFAKQIQEAKKRSGEFAYLFDFYEKLCEYLSVKYDLGYRSRTVYQSGDKKQLAKLLPFYKQSEKRLKKVLASFEKLWNTENKPSGFEVHELRIGGLIIRLQSCRKRIQAYLKGKIPRIEELEVELVDFYGGDELEKVLPTCWGAQYASTVNRRWAF